MKYTIKIAVLFFSLLFQTLPGTAQGHPNLILTQNGVSGIRANLGSVPLFDQTLAETQAEVDTEIELGIFVPIPKDMAGGYTHERHKLNFFILQKAGSLFQITEDEKYAVYIRDMLLAYAKMYPDLPVHPTQRSYATGKIFWQCLNDANWLVYVSQAYDCVHEFLTEEERETIENDLFRPFADFLSTGNPQFFNRIHNHSTWANAAVGMIGLAMNDEELVKRALYGLESDQIPDDLRDDDSGRIKMTGQDEAGFLAQLDHSFSPDGYFTEGPYYLRYAIYPFLLFSQSLANNRPDLDILNYRDAIVQKAIYGLLNQADPNGRFFPINDALKGMSIHARELITAVNTLYFYGGQDPTLVSIAAEQGKVLLDETGFAIAKAVSEGNQAPYRPSSMLFVDGKDGDEGGVAVLRAGEDTPICLVAKYTPQGMGHGHFDKLSLSLYDDSGEILQDYGSARWVNIDQKGGGRYLPENQTFAKQSIAHNTLVLNETSHYNGDIRIGELHHPELYFADIHNPKLQVVSTKDFDAYPNTQMHRTTVLLDDEYFQNPVVVDIVRAETSEENQYDLPYWFMGHLLGTDFEYQTKMTSLQTLGQGAGYQHIWHEATGTTDNGSAQITWFGNYRFYSLTTATTASDTLLFARGGANDPSFNLRHDPVFIIRKHGQGDITFASLIEAHGTYSPVTETPMHPYPQGSTVEVISSDELYTIVKLGNKEAEWLVMISNKDTNGTSKHKLEMGSETLNWTGCVSVKRTK